MRRRSRHCRALIVASCHCILFMATWCESFAPRQVFRSGSPACPSSRLYAQYSPPPPLPPPPQPSTGDASSLVQQVQQQLEDLIRQASSIIPQIPSATSWGKDFTASFEAIQHRMDSVSSALKSGSASISVDQLQRSLQEQLDSSLAALRDFVSELLLILRSTGEGAGQTSLSTSLSDFQTLLDRLPLTLLQSYKTIDIAIASVLTLVVLSTLISQITPPIRKVYPLDRYDPEGARAYFQQRPLKVMARALFIATQSLQYGLGLLQDYLSNSIEQNEEVRARQLAALLTRLGPSFIKVGQSLSIRTDLLRPAYLRGLATLQDQVPAFDTDVAKDILERSWGQPVSDVLVGPLPAQPVAAASLGQVYKATLRQPRDTPNGTGTTVAIKVQRPDILEQIALDMHLVREAAPVLKRLFALNTDVVAAVDAWGRGFVDELDYTQEAANAESFMENIASTPLSKVVFAPKVVSEYSTRQVLVTEWIDGERLDQSSQGDVTVLCSIAMNTYLTMLLDEKFAMLHCDPHPGNLLRTPDGRLCILDWGMVTRLDSDLQLRLIEHVAHLVSADYAEIPRDLLLLDFIPKDKAHLIEDSGVVEVLAEIYSAWSKGGGAATVNVNQVIQQLQDLAAKNNGNLFQLPAYFAYIAKSFSVLEGIGLTNDSNYSIIKECLPYISQRLLTDKRNLGPALNTFLFGPDKTDPDRIVDYERVEQLVEGFGDFTASTSGTLLDKDPDRRFELLESVADKVLDLLVTEEPSPIQDIFLEQLAKIIASGSRTTFERVRERSGVLPSGRTVLGTLVDPLGFWRTSPLVRANELDERTIETTQKLIDLMQRQFALNSVAGLDLSTLTREEAFELSSILTRKIWERRAGVVKTGGLLARQLLKLTADKLDAGERDTRRLPERLQMPSDSKNERPESGTKFENDNKQTWFADRNKLVSPRLEAARRRIAELEQEDGEMEIVDDIIVN